MLILLILVVIVVVLINYFGFWPVVLILTVLTIILVWFLKPIEEMELTCKYSRKTTAPPEFLFSLFFDADFRNRLDSDRNRSSDSNLVDMYVDREEVGGRIFYVYEEYEGYKEITKWNPPFEIGYSNPFGDIGTMYHNLHFENMPKGTCFTAQCRFTFNSTSNRIYLIIYYLAMTSLAILTAPS